MLVRVCVECGEEFRPGVLRCSDCGGELVAHDDEGQRPGATLQGETAEATRAIAWAEQARDLVPLADRLVEAGLVFRMGPRQRPGEERPRGFELLVRDQDVSAAARILAPLATPESGVTLVMATAMAAGPAPEPPISDEAGIGTCPACEAAVPALAQECPGCGLAFGGEPSE